MDQNNNNAAAQNSGDVHEPEESRHFRSDIFEPNSEAERAVLGLILRRGPITQTQISNEIDRSQQTVSRVLSRLVERGSLRQGERVSSGKRGQLSVNMEIVPEYAYAFGVVIYWDALAVTLMDFSGKVIDERSATMIAMTHDAVVAELQRMIAELEKQWGVGERVFGAGVGIPGTFMRESGRQVNTPLALEEWANINVEAVLADDLELPVWVENDGNAAAIGESLFGVGRWARDFVYFYIATGLGGGVIHDGELVRGAVGNAGEIAEMLPPQMFPHPNLDLLRKLVCKHDTNVSTVSDLIRTFDPDWTGVEEWIVRVRDSLSLIASAAAAILDPEAIVIGGRIPPVLAQKVIPKIEVYDQRRRSSQRPLPRIVVAEAGSKSPAMGAAALSFKKYFFR